MPTAALNSPIGLDINFDWATVTHDQDPIQAAYPEPLVSRLRERIKEKTCLLAISALVSDNLISVDEMLRQAVQVIPPGWQFPEICVARITYRGKTFTNRPPAKIKNQLEAPITANERELGTLTVAYDSQPDRSTHFLPEENELLLGIATMLGHGIQHRQQTATLRASRERYRHVIESISNWIWELDRDLVCVYCSPKIEQDLGISPDQIVGRTPMEFAAPERAQEIRDLFENAARQKAAIREVEIWQKNADGHDICILWNGTPLFDSNGMLLGFRGANQNITRRKNAERALRDLANFNQAIVESASLGITIHHSDGTCIKANPRAATILGASVDQLEGQDFRSLDSWSVSGMLACAEHVLQVGEPFHQEFLLHTSFETKVYVDVHFSRLEHQNNRHLLCLFSDLTNEYNAKKELAESREQLAQAQRMEAIGRLAGGVAHDFNNILQAMKGIVSLIQHAESIPNPILQHIEDLDHGVDRASDLTRQLLAFGRRQILEPTQLDLNALLGNLARMIERVIGEHIRLELRIDDRIGPVNADPGKIEQVVLNLCVNARDAMPNGGKLILQTMASDVDQAFCESRPWAKTGQYSVISVRDSGFGIDPALLGRIFEPFFTTKRVDKGTGLGLATSYGIVKQHGGMITVESQVGKGSTFAVYLPVSGTHPAVASPTKPDPVLGGHERVLVAEDDPAVRKVVQLTLENAGYQVITVNDGREAVDQFRRQDQIIDLAILDVIMPNMGGKDAYDWIKRIRPNAKIVFSSGYSDQEIHNNFVLNRDIELIQKPYKMQDLLTRVRSILDRT